VKETSTDVRGHYGPDCKTVYRERYDAGSNSWVPIAGMISARAYGTASVLLDGSVLLVGGSNSIGSPLASVERFDPSNRAFTAAGNMVTPRTRAAATPLLDGTVLVAGGASSGLGASALASAELYDPAIGL
jgi:hypothetical protein